MRRFSVFLSRLPVLMLAAVVSSCRCPGASADGVVNQPTEAELDAALAGGGTVTFACDGTIPFSRTKSITASTTLDAAGHNITLSGRGVAQLFYVGGPNSRITFRLNNLTLADGLNTGIYINGNAIYGGAMYVQDSSLIVTNCAFTNNAASFTSAGSIGGAIVINSTPPDVTTFTNCQFIGNSAIGSSGTSPSFASGGAISSGGSTNLTLSRCIFLNNTASGGSGVNSISTSGITYAYGGAVSAGHINATGCAFIGNSAVGGSIGDGSGYESDGGAVFAQDAVLTRCTFSNNKVQGGNAFTANQPGGVARGGALCLTGSTFSITNCTLADNVVTGGTPGDGGMGGDAHGGGIFYYAGVGSSVLLNCTIARNTARISAGGGTAGQSYGGGIENGYGFNFNTGAFTLINTIVAYNTADTGANGYGLQTDGGNNLCSDATCAFTEPSSGNNTDPRLGLLLNHGGSTYTMALLQGSPAIDAGNDLLAPATDQRGVPRPQGTHTDIGAYERADWQADAHAIGADNNTRLLWNNADGHVNLWNVQTGSGTVLSSNHYGPFAGWGATAIAVGADNNTRLLWNNKDGRIDLWNVNTSTGAILSSDHYGPFPGYTAVAISVGADNNTRILWRHVSGKIDLWNLNTPAGTDTASLLSSNHYGPFDGWMATAITTGTDNNTRLLWSHVDGRADLWNIQANAGIDTATLLFTYHYGPYAGYSPAGIGVGPNNNIGLVWSHVSGMQDLWIVNPGDGSVSTDYFLGPFHGYGSPSVTIGPDNNLGLLWSNVSGLQDVWRVNTSVGSVLSSNHFGPY